MQITANLPRKLPAKGLAILFGVSEQRISQLKRKGHLKPDADGLYDVQAATAARLGRMTEHGARMVAQTYSNGTGKISPPKATPLTQLTPDQELGLEPLPGEGPVTIDVTPSPNSHFAQQSRMMELRQSKLQYESELRELRVQKERGQLIHRAEVQTSAAEAAALVVTILQALPAEIASVFSTPEQKREVRAKVQQRIDQAQYALYKAMKDYTPDDEPGEGGAG